AHNILARLSYDPHRGIFQGVPSAAGYGGTVGSLVGGLGAVGTGARAADHHESQASSATSATPPASTAPGPLPLPPLTTLAYCMTATEWAAPRFSPEGGPSESSPSYEELAAKRLNPPGTNEGLFERIRRYSRPETLLENIRRLSSSGPQVSQQRRPVKPGP